MQRRPLREQSSSRLGPGWGELQNLRVCTPCDREVVGARFDQREPNKTHADSPTRSRAQGGLTQTPIGLSGAPMTPMQVCSGPHAGLANSQ